MSRNRHSMLVLLLTALTAGALVTCKREVKPRSGPMVKILAASGTIKPRTPLTIDVVEEREIPAELYTDSMLTPELLEPNRQRLIVHRMDKGTPLYFFNLESQETDRSLGLKLRPGGRGYPLRLEAGAELEGWLRDNDHVDVLATVPRPGGGPGETITITLIENLVVLRVATPVVAAEGKAPGFVTAVLLVLPEEAELLHQAETTGRVSLTLRNPDDRTLLQERAWSTLETLLTRKRVSASGRSPAPEAPVPPPPPPASDK